MKKEAYTKSLDILRKKHKLELFNLAKKYALANSKYEIGDVISDGVSIIRIERIQISCTSIMDFLPCCVYFGPLLKKKDHTPYVNGTYSSIYQHNIKDA